MQDRQEEIQEVRPTEETLKQMRIKKAMANATKKEIKPKSKKIPKDSQDEIQLGEDGTIQHLNISV